MSTYAQRSTKSNSPDNLTPFVKLTATSEDRTAGDEEDETSLLGRYMAEAKKTWTRPGLQDVTHQYLKKTMIECEELKVANKVMQEAFMIKIRDLEERLSALERKDLISNQ